jgi:hypothetical protein
MTTAEPITAEQIAAEIAAIEARCAELNAELATVETAIGEAWNEPEKTGELQNRASALTALLRGADRRRETLTVDRAAAERAELLADYEAKVKARQAADRAVAQIDAEIERVMALRARMLEQREPLREAASVASGREMKVLRTILNLRDNAEMVAAAQEIQNRYQ